MMVFLLNTLNPDQVKIGFQALTLFASSVWGWPPGRLREELLACQMILQKTQGKTTVWFEGDQIYLDYTLDETRTDSIPEGDQRGDSPDQPA